MAQYARPESDITYGSWTDEGTVDNDGYLYTSVDETTIDNDSSYLQGSNGAGTGVIKLSTIGAPTTPASCTLYIYFRSIGSGAGEKMNFYLVEDYEGSPVTRASYVNQSNRSSSYANGAGACDLSAVTDWGNLYVQFDENTIGSGEYVRITQIYLETDDAAGVPSSDSQSAYAKGGEAASDNQPAWLAGGIVTSDTQNAYLSGVIAASDNQNAYTNGIGPPTTDPAITLAYLVIPPSYGGGASDSKHAYLSGIATTSDNQDAYLLGSSDADDFQHAWLLGSQDDSDTQNAYLLGSSDASSTKNAYLKGQDTDSDAIHAYLHGSADASDSKHAYTGGLLGASESKHAYTHGSSTASDNQNTWLAGGLTDSDNQHVYLTGNATASSSKHAFMQSGDVASDNQHAYLQGKDTASDSQHSYLLGSIDTSDSKHGYLNGSLDTSDSQHGYLKGRDTDSDNQNAYLTGNALATSSTHAWIDGLGEWMVPDGDISQSDNWQREDTSTSNLYVSIDESPPPDDDDYVWYDDVVTGKYFEVSLSNPSGPTVGSGDVEIMWRIRRRSGGQTITFKVELRQNTTVIASDSHVLTDTDTTYRYTLTSGERSNITDWTDLRLRFVVESVA